MAKYEVMVDTLGANPTFSKGDIIDDNGEMKPPYDFGHLVRNGAIRKVVESTATTVHPSPAVMPASSTSSAAEATSQAQGESQQSPRGEASTGHHAVSALDVLDADQQAAMRAAGLDTDDKIRAASDDDLKAVEGIGPATIRKLREAAGA
jgi:predicted flap endonuclease-1-like 5' DNA nuclease